MGKKDQGPAASPETPTIVVTPKEPEPPPAPAAEDQPKPGEKRPVSFWAHRAGHVPEKAKSLAFRGLIHTGPHYEVVIVHARTHGLPAFARNAMVTEEEYAECVKAAYSIECRENWTAKELEERQADEAGRAEELRKREEAHAKQAAAEDAARPKPEQKQEA